MDYYFEHLGDEKFQKLCQSILVASFPDILCLPVGQPDGGRDAVIRSPSIEEAKDVIIFQVKFVKNPNAKTSRDFIKSIIKSEKEKVENLKARGARKYYLITNACGTSHIDVGSIDLVNQELADELGIESHCWWRDDLNRRLDNNSSVKWSFPEILKATDLLEQLINTNQNLDSKRRGDAIRSYMAYQAKQDSQLKFKQVELQGGIIEQYVDIPIQFIPPLNDAQESNQSKISTSVSAALDSFDEYPGLGDDEADEEFEADIYGALELLVHPDFSKTFDNLVIEGAPGQGKSTVTQYLCQVNRLMLLGRTNDIKNISKSHLPVEPRIPFRIDLRDYASWLSGKNPFVESEAHLNSALFPLANPILESFVAAQISRYTGSTFEVDDLTALSKIANLLFILDGFDEVADIKIRNKIVSEVSDASVRISENALSAQIIVTSRPTAFANSPGFPKAEWQHVKLLPLSKGVVESYAEKWLNGRAFEQREKDEILQVLQEKLLQTHVRELAKNPMQLAILLALISVQGASLPDKRTALYDNYIEIFLNRESEKNRTVRVHRDLLVQIHRYLAWVLQSEAEEKSEAGNITESRLRTVLKDFLMHSGHPPELVDEIFTGMIERVVALVSRVQGTYEFEVQPLREYFTARYLYDTAPYSPAGVITKGTLPDRFDAIARNFYWLNVTRFYAGCYSSGELSSLIDGLENLSDSAEFKHISQPSRLGFLLLKDYVFNQQPKLALRAVKVLTKSLGFRILFSDLWMSRYEDTIMAIPHGLGRNLLAETFKNIIRSASASDTIYTACRALTQNCSYDEALAFWNDLKNTEANSSKLLRIGSALGIFEKIDKPEVFNLIKTRGEKAFISILRNQRLDLLVDQDEEFVRIFLSYAKNSGGAFLYFSKYNGALNAQTWLACATLMLSSGYFLTSFDDDSTNRTIRSFSEGNAFRNHISNLDALERDVYENSDMESDIAIAISAASALYDTPIENIKITPLSSSNFIEAMRKLWGNSNTLTHLAVVIAQVFEGDTSALASDTLLGRTVDARDNILNNNLNSWIDGITITTNEAKHFVAVCLFAWSTASILLDNFSRISAIVDDLNDSEWKSLVNAIGPHGYISRDERYDLVETDIVKIEEAKSLRALSLLSTILTDDANSILFQRHFNTYSETDTYILQTAINSSIKHSWQTGENWMTTLELIRKGYQIDVICNLRQRHIDGENQALPEWVARTICESPSEYPIEALTNAEARLNTVIGQAIVPVGKIAAIDNWLS